MSAQEVPCFYVIVQPWSKMETLFSSFDPLLQNSVSVTILSLMLRIESDPIFCFSAFLLRCPASGRTRCNPESYSFGCPESSFSSFLGVERYRLSSWLLLQLSLCVCFFFLFLISSPSFSPFLVIYGLAASTPIFSSTSLFSLSLSFVCIRYTHFHLFLMHSRVHCFALLLKWMRSLFSISLPPSLQIPYLQFCY